MDIALVWTQIMQCCKEALLLPPEHNSSLYPYLISSCGSHIPLRKVEIGHAGPSLSVTTQSLKTTSFTNLSASQNILPPPAGSLIPPSSNTDLWCFRMKDSSHMSLYFPPSSAPSLTQAPYTNTWSSRVSLSCAIRAPFISASVGCSRVPIPSSHWSFSASFLPTM